ncbi:hypothetical protein N0V88_006582 [Collariella sp. IMI 366227]|nr:hypothetical protein N0V88_006582 [Collariella sp. IMI 366227]
MSANSPTGSAEKDDVVLSSGTADPETSGQPRICLDRPSHMESPENDLLKYLARNHETEALDGLMKFMRYIFVQTPSWQHIKPLHHQKSHAREVKVTESPGLHLVWYYEMMFIKPIPAYFYSGAFWDYTKNSNEKLHKACIGFMRSYYLIIQYEIDFNLARDMSLIPKKSNGTHPTYLEWCKFMEQFSHVGDNHVNSRFHYGELRLTRINRAALLFKGKLAYWHIYPQWGSFLEHTLAPIVTIFAVFSVVLNSMQVGLAAMDAKDPVGVWSKFVDASLWFPIVVMILIAFVLGIALMGMLFMGVKDVFHGSNVRAKKKEFGGPKEDKQSHGMIW